MRTEGQIRQQLKQVLYRHLQKKLRVAFRRHPRGCQHNQLVALDGQSKVGLCFHLAPGGVEPRWTPCDERVLFKGGYVHLTCPYYTPLKTKEALKTEFRDLLQSGDRGRIAAEYPDVAALLWVLDNQDLTEEIKSAEAEADKAEPEGAVSWRPEG